MRRVFKINETIWDDHDKRWGTIVLVNGQDRDDVADLDGIITYKPEEGEGETQITALECYQIAGERWLRGKAVCWEHNEEIDYPFYCPEEEENCYHFEVE